MSIAAIEARRAALARLERAAGTAFGYDEGEATTAPARRLSPATTLAFATLATTVAATLTYLV